MCEKNLLRTEPVVILRNYSAGRFSFLGLIGNFMNLQNVPGYHQNVVKGIIILPALVANRFLISFDYGLESGFSETQIRQWGRGNQFSWIASAAPGTKVP